MKLHAIASRPPRQTAMSALRAALLLLLVLLPRLLPSGPHQGVAALQSTGFAGLSVPLELPDTELVAPPSQLDPCRCQQACAARPGCLSFSYCPRRSHAACRLYGRWGNDTIWKDSERTCAMFVRTGSARLTDFCVSKSDCAAVGEGARCLGGVCGCPPPLVADGERCVLPPPK